MNNLIKATLALMLMGNISCSDVQTEEKTPDNHVKTATKGKIAVPGWVKNATLYEVNIRQFTDEGTFQAIVPHLDRLADMGVDILWLMPVHPISETKRKGTLGSV